MSLLQVVVLAQFVVALALVGVMTREAVSVLSFGKVVNDDIVGGDSASDSPDHRSMEEITATAQGLRGTLSQEDVNLLCEALERVSMDIDSNPLFEVISPRDGRHLQVYADGRVTGLDDWKDLNIVNNGGEYLRVLKIVAHVYQSSFSL